MPLTSHGIQAVNILLPGMEDGLYDVSGYIGPCGCDMGFYIVLSEIQDCDTVFVILIHLLIVLIHVIRDGTDARSFYDNAKVTEFIHYIINRLFFMVHITTTYVLLVTFAFMSN